MLFKRNKLKNNLVTLSVTNAKNHNIMRKSELKIQAEVCTHIWQNHPETRYCLYHVANEAQRSPVEWGQLKAAGFIKGIQDLHLLWRGVTYRIEMKGDGGKIDPWQKVVHKAHALQGSETYVFWNAEDAIRFIEDVINGVYSWQTWVKFVSPYCGAEYNLNTLILEAKK